MTSRNGSASRRRWATASIASVGNVGDWDSTVAAFEKVKAEHGPVHVLVNNAGITRDGMFRKMSRSDWHDVIETNLTSLFNVTKQVIDDMCDQGWGRIINISSVNGEKGQFGQTNYSAAKAGMHGFTMALAQEVANKGVTVNTVSPGYIATDMVKAIRQDVLDKIVAGIPGQAPGHARRTSPRWCRGWPPKNPASPPAPTSRSTAGCIWGSRASGLLLLQIRSDQAVRSTIPSIPVPMARNDSQDPSTGANTTAFPYPAKLRSIDRR